jgi:predicted lipoprotein with Yx(FWY)xxD motif
MERVATRLGAAVAIVALLGLVAAFYAVRANGAEHVRIVMTAKNKTLGKKILVNRRGMTLYSLSVERKGHFICTDMTCLSLWKPLTIAKGAVAIGVAHLSVVGRPDGRRQVAYRGGPLYTFVQDKAPRRREGQRLQGRRRLARGNRCQLAGEPAADDDRRRLRRRWLRPLAVACGRAARRW